MSGVWKCKRDDDVPNGSGSARALACSLPRPRGTHGPARTMYTFLIILRAQPIGEGAGRNTRGRVCSPRWVQSRVALGVASFVLLVASAGCRQEMYDQPRHKPLHASSFFSDGMSARPLLAGTVPRGFLRTN